MTIPSPLQPGDTIAITATSGIVSPDRLDAGIHILKHLGLQVKVLESCHATEGSYLAGDDTLRLNNLHQAFGDSSIKAIMIARGGYGAGRLLPYLDYGFIAKNPKIFIGYSDVTALHIVLNQQCKLATYHGPMASCLGGISEAAINSLKQALFTTQPLMPTGHRLVGGNLTVITSTLGTPYEIDTQGKILFLEDINEEPYKVDRMLLQLKLAGKLDDITAVALGDFTPESLATLDFAIKSHIKKPIIHGLLVGHIKDNFTLPLGRRVTPQYLAQWQVPLQA